MLLEAQPIDPLKDRVVVAKIRTRLGRVLLGNYGDYKKLGGDLFELEDRFWPRISSILFRTGWHIVVDWGR